MADSVIKGTISLDEALERVVEPAKSRHAAAKAEPRSLILGERGARFAGCFSVFEKKPRRRLSRKSFC
jgi:hypothetical protein